MSKRGNGGDDADGKPDDSGEPGMAIIRRQRRATLEKTLRSGAPNPETEKPNAAAAWGTVLQREARGEPPKAEPLKAAVPKAETPKPSAPRPPEAGAGSPASGTHSPRVPGSPGTTGSMPRVPTGAMPRVTTGGLPNLNGRGRPETGPLPSSARAPSTAAPEDVEPSPELALAREAHLLASAHDERESRNRFRMFSVGNVLRLAAAALLVVACAWLIVAPAKSVVGRAERTQALAIAVAEITARIEADPRLSAALAARELPVLSEIFAQAQRSGRDALQQAGFAGADEHTLRVRLADGGQALAVSAEFPEADGEVVAATRKTGQRQAPPPVPSLVDVITESYMLNVAALTFTALAGVVLLVLWPWLRRRRRA